MRRECLPDNVINTTNVVSSQLEGPEKPPPPPPPSDDLDSNCYLYLLEFEQNEINTSIYSVTFEIIKKEAMDSFLNSNSVDFQIFNEQTFVWTFDGVTMDLLKSWMQKSSVTSGYYTGSWYVGNIKFTSQLNDNNHLVHVESFYSGNDYDIYSVTPIWISLIAFPSTLDLNRPTTGDTIYRADIPYETYTYAARIPARFGFDVYNSSNNNRIFSAHPIISRKAEGSSFVGSDLEDDVRITSIGIIDVGIAGCNLLIKKNLPLCYFDVGKPLPKYSGTLPLKYLPIPNVPVILSHWDWDHWTMALDKNCKWLECVDWYINKDTPYSATAGAFKDRLSKNGKLIETNGHCEILPTNAKILICSTKKATTSFKNNNIGLAMQISNIQFNGTHKSDIVMTGDANFASVVNLIDTSIAGINAVHHGSSTHKSSKDGTPKPRAENIQKKAVENFNGRIAYSYGMEWSSGSWFRPYGIPSKEAIKNYENNDWGTLFADQMSTAEGADLLGNPIPATEGNQPPNRGNIRMGDQTPLDDKYKGSSFYPVKHVLN